jgi:hypothetical protein
VRFEREPFNSVDITLFPVPSLFAGQHNRTAGVLTAHPKLSLAR